MRHLFLFLLLAQLGAIPRLILGAESYPPPAEPRSGPRFREITRHLSKDDVALIEEYRLSFGKLRTVYGNCQMEVIHRQSGHRPAVSPENPEGHMMRRLLYLASGREWFRLDVQQLDWKTEQPAGLKTVHLVGPEAIFTARRSSPDGSLAIIEVYPNPNDLLLGNFGIIDIQSAPYPPLAERQVFGHEDAWRIDRVQAFEEAEARLAAIEVSREMEGLTDKYRYEFLRDASWALRSSFSEHTAPSQPQAMILWRRLEYSGEKDGVPLLKHASYWREVGQTKERYREEDFTVTSFIPEPAPESEFLPSAVGLRLGRTTANWIPRILVLILGVVLIALYQYLKRRVPGT